MATWPFMDMRKRKMAVLGETGSYYTHSLTRRQCRRRARNIDYNDVKRQGNDVSAVTSKYQCNYLYTQIP